MKNLYPKEKFSDAINTLATSPKSIQKRVCDAYIYSLIHIKPEEIPEEIQNQFKSIIKKLTCVEAIGDEGNAAATTNEMKTDDAISIARDILEMAYIVRRD